MAYTLAYSFLKMATRYRSKVYVPKQRKDQTVAFSTVLPRKLLWWLMEYPEGHIEDHTDTAAITALCLIFSCEIQALDDVLDRQSILRIDVDNVDDPESEAEEVKEEEAADADASVNHSFPNDARTETETLAEVSAQSHMARDRSSQSSGPTIRPYTPQSSNYSVSSPTRSTATAQSSYSLAAFPLSSSVGPILSTPVAAGVEDGRYRATLERVVDSARSASFPSRGAFNLDSLRNALFFDMGGHASYSFNGIDVSAGLRSETQLERDKKVGAAGELYVSTFLSTLCFQKVKRKEESTNIFPRYTSSFQSFSCQAGTSATGEARFVRMCERIPSTWTLSAGP
jgi:hypothetical protein